MIYCILVFWFIFGGLFSFLPYDFYSLFSSINFVQLGGSNAT